MDKFSKINNRCCLRKSTLRVFQKESKEREREREREKVRVTSMITGHKMYPTGCPHKANLITSERQ